MLKVAVLGGEQAAADYAELFGQLPSVYRVGAYDPGNERGEASTTQSVIAASASFDAWLAAANPDAVCIAVSDHRSVEWAAQSLRQGKHVICQSPWAGTLTGETASQQVQSLQELVQLAEQSGVQLLIGNEERYAPYFQDIKKNVAAGSIGEPGVVHMQRYAPHLCTDADCGRAADDAGTDCIFATLLLGDAELLRSLIGEVKSVYAKVKSWDGRSYAIVTIRFQNRTIVNWEGFQGYPDRPRLKMELAGRQGIIRHDSRNINSFESRRYTAELPAGSSAAAVIQESPLVHSPLFLQLSHWIDCLIRNAAPISSAVDACQAARIVDAARQSAETGLPVQLAGER